MDAVRLAKKGNLDAFNRLVLAHQDDVYDFVHRALGEAAEGARAAQKVFVQAYQGLNQYRGSSFRNYLLRHAVDCCRTGVSGDAGMDERLAVALVDGEQMSYAEAAAVLGVSRKDLIRLVARGRWRTMAKAG